MIIDTYVKRLVLDALEVLVLTLIVQTLRAPVQNTTLCTF